MVGDAPIAGHGLLIGGLPCVGGCLITGSQVLLCASLSSSSQKRAFDVCPRFSFTYAAQLRHLCRVCSRILTGNTMAMARVAAITAVLIIAQARAIPSIGIVNYDPCANASKGETCTVCDPTDTSCVETTEVKSCQDDQTTLDNALTCMPQLVGGTVTIRYRTLWPAIAACQVVKPCVVLNMLTPFPCHRNHPLRDLRVRVHRNHPLRNLGVHHPLRA